jgi:hypothetical protein
VKIDALLDTNVIIDILQGHQPALDWYADAEMMLVITPVVWFETLEGSQNKLEYNRALKLLNAFAMEHSTVSDDLWAMTQYGRLLLSHGLEWSDCLIASVALRLNVPIFTGNLRHFQLLPGITSRKPY